MVDPRTPVPRDIAAVSAAHFAGARSMTAHLIGLGHRRIGLLNLSRQSLGALTRLRGYRAALEARGADIDE